MDSLTEMDLIEFGEKRVNYLGLEGTNACLILQIFPSFSYGTIITIINNERARVKEGAKNERA